MLKVHINKKEFYVVQIYMLLTLLFLAIQIFFLKFFLHIHLVENVFELTKILSFKLYFNVLIIEFILA